MVRERQRLALGFFWYFTAIGLFVPYWPMYLAGKGLGPLEIGLVMGVFAGVRVVGPPAYAHWADLSGRRLGLLRAAALAALLCALSFLWLDSVWSIALALAAYSALWNGIVSVYDAHVLDRLGADSGRYGLLRLWGSVGFIVMALLAGWAFRHASLELLPAALAAAIGATWLSLRGLGEGPPAPAGVARTRLVPLLAEPRVRVFLAVVFLMAASHGAYYNFFSIHLERLGYGRVAIGALWAWAVIAEIAVFLLGRQLLERFSLRVLTIAALALTSLRWVMLAGWPGEPLLVFASQTLHLASFGVFHLCAVSIAALLFPRDAAARGQAIHGSVGFGLGGLVGAIASGWLWRESSPQAVFLVSAGLTLAAALLASVGLKGLPLAVRQVQNA